MFWYLVLCASHRPSLQDLLRDISRRLKSTLKASAKVRGSGDKVKGFRQSCREPLTLALGANYCQGRKF